MLFNQSHLFALSAVNLETICEHGEMAENPLNPTSLYNLSPILHIYILKSRSV